MSGRYMKPVHEPSPHYSGYVVEVERGEPGQTLQMHQPGVRDLSTTEAKEVEAAQALEMHQPTVGDLGSIERNSWSSVSLFNALARHRWPECR